MKVIPKAFALMIIACAVLPLNGAEKPEVQMKTAVVYYSYTGKTEIVSNTLGKELNADVFKIEDTQRPSTFKAYFLGSFAARKGKTWPIKPINLDISKYDRIFVGAPIWWGKTAPEMNTFIDQTDFSGKSAIVFVTMAASDPKEAINSLTERIIAKGGSVISSFSIKTGGLTKDAVTAETEGIVKQYLK